MTLELYIAILLTILVLATLAVAIAIVLTLIQIKRAARAVEFLAGRAEDHLVQIASTLGNLGQMAADWAGGLGRKAAFGASVLYGLMQFFRRKNRSSYKKEEPGGSDE